MIIDDNLFDRTVRITGKYTRRFKLYSKKS